MHAQPMPDLRALRPLVKQHLDWSGWEALIEENGLTIDRPRGIQHPDFPEIIYPMDYGYVNGTLAGDGREVDAFVGTAASGLVGLVGLILTCDHRRGKREAKLLYRCTPREVYLANGFINFDRTLIEGLLALRRPMQALWEVARCWDDS